jgi:lipopolysaccharide export LptBFGC system permease protein LptF
MQKTVEIAMAALILMIVGTLVIVFANTMIPTIVQSNADLLNESVSGVALTPSQENIIAASGNMEVLLYSIIGVLIIIAGVALLLYDAFSVTKGKR